MDQEFTTAFAEVHQKIEKIADKLSGKIDLQVEEIHSLKMGVQRVGGDLLVCQKIMGPRVDAIEERSETTRRKWWDVWRPVVSRGVEVLVVGLIFLAYYILKKKGGI